MSLKKIITKNLEDNAVTEPKIASEAVTAEKLGTDFITGLTELTSVAEDDNLMIYDASAGVLKKVSKANTTTLATPTFSSVSPDNSQTVDGGNITFTITGTGFTTGTNARLIGASGQRLNFSSVTRSSTTSITAVIARSSLLLAQSPYGVQVINGEGLSVTAASQISIDTTPIFNTSAGSLGTFTEGDSIDVEVSAYDPDSTSDITFELQSGSLPAGLSLVNQSGDSCRIQGTASAVSADTTSNFTLRATDSASNTVSRSFSITIEDFALNGLRFDDGSSDYLTFSPASTSNRRTHTTSFWFKIGITSGSKYIFSTGDYGAGDGFLQIYVSSSGRMGIGDYNQSADSYNMNWTTPSTGPLFRDPSAWYHMVLSVDTTQATQSDRVKVYINGTDISSQFTKSVDTVQNDEFEVNISGKRQQWGRSQNNDNYFDGYLSQIHFIDGTALTASSFGETDATSGIWVPKAYSGSFGTNGYHLDFANSADLGNDVSGNNNDFTENNITSIDKVEDTPQNNYLTANPLDDSDSAGYTFSDGNLKLTPSGSDQNSSTRSTFGISAGKWYWEWKVTEVSSGEGCAVGITPDNTTGQQQSASTYFGAECQFSSTNTLVKKNDGGSTSNIFTDLASGDIIMQAYDYDNGNMWIGKNGTWYNSGNPASATNATISSIPTTPRLLFFSNYKDASANHNITELNFGNPTFSISSGNSDGNGYGNFEYAVPTGFYALNTKNLAQYG